MTLERGTFVRLQARLRAERGFSLLETVIAIGVIFSALTVLAYAATAGFGYQALARERQGANSIADKIMEDVRGLAYAKIQAGMAASELAGDPNLVTSCVGDPAGTYRFMSCSGEMVVKNGQPNTPPLVPHTGTLSAGYPTAYAYQTYVTQQCPTATSPGCTAVTPYRVSVIVSWTGGAVQGVSRSVRTQSLFWSPDGCVKNSTHPYAAPCQPFFFGQAQVPRGAITISGQIMDLGFEEAELMTSGAESDAQQEQFSAAQASFSQSGAVLADDSGGTQTLGGVPAVTAGSDTDPSGTVPAYGTQTMGSGLGGSASLAQGQTSFTVTAPSGDAATANSATTASASQSCPPWVPKEVDNTLCAGSQIQQGSTGSLTATGAFAHVYKNIQMGSASIATIGTAASNPNKTFVDRQLVAGQDGKLVSTVTRRFGTVNLVGLPSGLSPLAVPAGWTGYLVTLSDYQDTATATVGTGATAPTGSVTSGTISYWNGTGYTSVSATQTVTPSPITILTTVNGHQVEIDITSTPLVGATFTSTSTALAGSPAAIGDADATISGPLTGTITYVIKVDPGTADEETLVQLDVRVALGSMAARGVYQRAPTAG